VRINVNRRGKKTGRGGERGGGGVNPSYPRRMGQGGGGETTEKYTGSPPRHFHTQGKTTPVERDGLAANKKKPENHGRRAPYVTSGEVGMAAAQMLAKYVEGILKNNDTCQLLGESFNYGWDKKESRERHGKTL